MSREHGIDTRSEPFRRAAEDVAAASQRFVTALIRADPLARDMLAEDPAAGLGRFGIGGALARRLFEDSRTIRSYPGREPPA